MKIRLLFLLAVILFHLPAWTKDVYFKHLPTIDGFSLQSAISIWQDQLGNMWFGNNILNKYDGNGIKTYQLSDYLDGIKDTNIKQICGDRITTMYILADTEIVIYDISYDRFIKTDITADYIFTSKDGTFYYTQNKCLYSYNYKDNISEKVLEINYPLDIIKSVIISENKEVWLGTNKGLFVAYDGEMRCVIDDINIPCLFEDSHRNIWAGTVSDGLRIVKRDTGEVLVFKEEQPLSTDAKLSNNRIRCFSEDDKQNIWIGTYRGITMYSLNTEKAFTLVHNESAFYSLRHNSVYSIYKDQQGSMWVGSYYGGVSYFNPVVELYSFYGTSSVDNSMLSGFLIGNMAEDGTGILYMATEEGGINIFNPNTGSVKKYNKSNSNLPHNTIKSIWYDNKYKRLYVGTFTEGLWYKEDGAERFIKIGDAILTTYNRKVISQILPYNEDFVLVATQDDVYRLNRKTLELTILLKTSDLNYENVGIVRTMFIDSEEILWVSTSDKGFLNIDLKTLKVQHFSNNEIGINTDKVLIQKIQEGIDGKIYLLTQSHLLVYDKTSKSFAFLNNGNDGLLPDMYYNMALLPTGRFIITSDKGFTIIDPESLDSKHLPFAEIFPLKSINSTCGLYIASNNENIYVGGVGGMLVMTEKDIEIMSSLHSSSHHLYFSSLSINNQLTNPQSSPDILPMDISYVKSINLNYKQNNISLTFASSDFIHSNSIQYEYILENFDKQWTISNDKVIRYTSLPPGSYSLVIREANNKSKNVRLDINITPPFYTSIWAYIIYSILLVLLLAYIMRFTQKNALLKASLKMEHREKLHLAELNQMKVNFFTNVSHEFRTPLTLISSQIDITLNNASLTQSIKNRFLKIKKHTQEMQLLIDELMYFNKLEQGTFPIKISKQDISSFVNDVYSSFKEYAQTRNIAFVYDYTNEPIDVWFDRPQMQKVIYNLLSNAFKFTDDGGAIVMALKRKKGYVEITVKDNGIGIKKEELDKIFERFYQANQDATTQWMEGMGVGLALCKNIVNQHHGDIFVESKAGESTCFTVRLLLGDAHFSDEQKGEWSFNETEYLSKIQPGSKADTETEENAEDSITVTDNTKSDILIIEDNEELLQLLIEAFSPIYNVTTAEDGEAGLNKAIEMKPDIVLTDVMMPRMSGLDICKKLKSRTDTSHIPVVLITARSSLKQNIEGLQYGADDYIVKPFNIELLLLKCNNLIRTRKDLLLKYQTMNNTISDDQNTTTNLTTNSIDQRFLENAVTIVEANLNNTEFDVNVWAKELNIGRSKLFQKIRDITGHTPNEYIIIIKMKKATLLLKENPEMTVAEIAYQVGFSSPGYFSKSFKEYYGMTPIQYRQS
ncbi:MAG: response regulator [Dysgonomonas sp.]|nr:response regulator [Dysgonomonas sp.]